MKNPEFYSRFAVFGGLFGIRPVVSVGVALLFFTLIFSTGLHFPLYF